MSKNQSDAYAGGCVGEIGWVELMGRSDLKLMHEVSTFHHRGSFLRTTPIENRRYMPSTEDSASWMSRDTVMVQGGMLIELLDSCDIEQLRRSPIRFKACSPLDIKEISKIFSIAFRSDPETLLRPYPSGGRIYPIELFFLDLSSSRPEPLHYLHNRHAFERLSSECSDWESALLGPQHPWGEPIAALIYVLNLPKSLVKYRYRGYRLALIEAGCMMQQGSTAVVEVGLRDRITNAFSDNELAACLGLNPACFLPIAVQIIGKADDYLPTREDF